MQWELLPVEKYSCPGGERDKRPIVNSGSNSAAGKKDKKNYKKRQKKTKKEEKRDKTKKETSVQ